MFDRSFRRRRYVQLCLDLWDLMFHFFIDVITWPHLHGEDAERLAHVGQPVMPKTTLFAILAKRQTQVSEAVSRQRSSFGYQKARSISLTLFKINLIYYLDNKEVI